MSSWRDSGTVGVLLKSGCNGECHLGPVTSWNVIFTFFCLHTTFRVVMSSVIWALISIPYRNLWEMVCSSKIFSRFRDLTPKKFVRCLTSFLPAYVSSHVSFPRVVLFRLSIRGGSNSPRHELPAELQEAGLLRIAVIKNGGYYTQGAFSQWKVSYTETI